MEMDLQMVTSKQPKYVSHSAARGMTEAVATKRTVNGLARSYIYLNFGLIDKEIDTGTVYFRQLRYPHEMLQMPNTPAW